MTKNRSSEILAVKMEIFSEKKRNSEILVREDFFRIPQTRRQVSSTGDGQNSFQKYFENKK